jgi:hypothetical protein
VSVAALLSACVYAPRTIQVYDHECRIMANHMVLEGAQVAAIQRCENQGCVAIVVVGNIAYWFERKARCQSAL